ncbi:2674_t:CDS:2 [Ambispora gerdemannii]|uniref:2674_t:CDS:1 n=1 Tax=Ambispora gerdemannii TaxID=144530 RepID=A0A9N9BV71_9GLOM|nr:2674_t:CDS:2 [Ambispora gerdemannii]
MADMKRGFSQVSEDTREALVAGTRSFSIVTFSSITLWYIRLDLLKSLREENNQRAETGSTTAGPSVLPSATITQGSTHFIGFPNSTNSTSYSSAGSSGGGDGILDKINAWVDSKTIVVLVSVARGLHVNGFGTVPPYRVIVFLYYLF